MSSFKDEASIIAEGFSKVSLEKTDQLIKEKAGYTLSDELFIPSIGQSLYKYLKESPRTEEELKKYTSKSSYDTYDDQLFGFILHAFISKKVIKYNKKQKVYILNED